MRNAKPGEKNLANAGAGDHYIVEPARAAAGTDMGGGVDIASAYVRLSTKEGQKLGTYLVSQHLKEQPIEVEGKTYGVSLRFKRTYKPYQVTLLDVRKDDYLGTSTVKNYSSDVHLVDKTNAVDRDVHIWMNNPLRYAGETFYQSKYDRDPATGKEMTALAVVSNTGWMIPYVSCMIVATGMLAHFFLGLVRFLNRRPTLSVTGGLVASLFGPTSFLLLLLHINRRVTEPPTSPDTSQGRGRKGKGSKKDRKNSAREDLAPVELAPLSTSESLLRFVPLFVVVVFAAYLGSKARPPQAPIGEMNVYAFGKLPVVYEGRVKPFDTLAHNFLRVVSNKQTYIDADGNRQPAVRWLLDVISGDEDGRDEQVFRIDNYRVLELFDIEPRKSNLYSVDEIAGGIGEFEKQVLSAREKSVDDLSVFERKLLELERRLQAYIMLTQAFHPPALPPLPTPEETQEQGDAFRSKLSAVAMAAMREAKMLESRHPPLAIPLKTEDGKSNEVQWEPYATAWTRALLSTRIGYNADPATVSMSKILLAYRDGDVKTFNNEVASYQARLEKDTPEGLDLAKTRFETFFNQFEPFYYCSVLYVVAFMLAVLAWLGWSGPLNRSAFWLIAFTLVVHTLALAGRIYISGRPPVTNLYSSAIFIGWGAVVFGLIFESSYRLGFGNIIAAVGGFMGLVIAHLLTTTVPSFRGDTFTVMQAVLDTQFWLATHVVCITMGYAATFTAGLMGLLYIIMGVATPALTPKVSKDLSRMTYGTICFAIFFSFVGTVLGGLWADDSWGRFWGWDPKENGALIIVLWNALVLHARWDGMVKERGLAALAVFGNVVTSWSWFGVNELGVGLHSYGFTEGVLLALILFVASQLVMIGVACLPKSLWWSFNQSRHA